MIHGSNPSASSVRVALGGHRLPAIFGGVRQSARLIDVVTGDAARDAGRRNHRPRKGAGVIAFSMISRRNGIG